MLPIPRASVASTDSDWRKIFFTTSPTSCGNFCMPNFSSELILPSVAAMSCIAVFKLTFVCGRKALPEPSSCRRIVSGPPGICRRSIGLMPVVSINGIKNFSSLHVVSNVLICACCIRIRFAINNLSTQSYFLRREVNILPRQNKPSPKKCTAFELFNLTPE